jgi:hypothetical protein
MKKLMLLALLTGLVSPAYAQLGGLSLPGKSKSNSGDIGVEVARFNEDTFLIRETVTFALFQIRLALDDKEKIAELKAKSDAIASTTDAKELNSKEGSSIKENSAWLQEQLDSDAAKEKVKQLSPDMKKKVGQAILNVAIAGLKTPDLISRGQNIIKDAGSNPLMLPKVIPVKDGLAMMADFGPKLPVLASSGFKLMKAVKIDPGTPSADAALKADKTPSVPE